MTIHIHERPDSRSLTNSIDSPTIDLVLAVTGSDDEVAVRAAIESYVPATYENLYLKQYTLTPKGNAIWEAVASYGRLEPKDTAESQFSFDTGGGTTHITQSLATVARYPADAPDCKGAIGVAGDNVEGTDITIPVYNFTETHYIDANLVTGAYKATLFSLTGKVNNAAFRGFAAGEVLFLGASGSVRRKEDWAITFRFAASPNVTGLQVGDITGIDKKGWEYLWVLYADAADQQTRIKRPRAVYVEKVYEEGDFSGLGIGT